MPAAVIFPVSCDLFRCIAGKMLTSPPSGTAKQPKNLRTAPQSCDQSWDNALNAALKRSVDSGKPIRVLRGFGNSGPYAPVAGYRYDGLYQAIRAWEDRSEAGFLICRVALVRLPGQPPLPIHPDRVHLISDAHYVVAVSAHGKSIRAAHSLTILRLVCRRPSPTPLPRPSPGTARPRAPARPPALRQLRPRPTHLKLPRNLPR